MRHTEFWARMESTFGAGYAHYWASNHVMSELGGRTVEEALADGESPKRIWAAVHLVRELPESEK